jgi:hypothetical protein
MMTSYKFSGELFATESRMLDAVAEAWLSPPYAFARQREAHCAVQ